MVRARRDKRAAACGGHVRPVSSCFLRALAVRAKSFTDKNAEYCLWLDCVCIDECLEPILSCAGRCLSGLRTLTGVLRRAFLAAFLAPRQTNGGK